MRIFPVLFRSHSSVHYTSPFTRLHFHDLDSRLRARLNSYESGPFVTPASRVPQLAIERSYVHAQALYRYFWEICIDTRHILASNWSAQ